MSRLDSFIRRVSAQRDCLNMAKDMIADIRGPVLELGLGNGRTYDHLREIFPDREIFVFDRRVAAHPDCIPDDAHMILGDITETLGSALDQIGGQAAFAHCDIGTGEVEQKRQNYRHHRADGRRPDGARRHRVQRSGIHGRALGSATAAGRRATRAVFCEPGEEVGLMTQIVMVEFAAGPERFDACAADLEKITREFVSLQPAFHGARVHREEATGMVWDIMEWDAHQDFIEFRDGNADRIGAALGEFGPKGRMLDV